MISPTTRLRRLPCSARVTPYTAILSLAVLSVAIGQYAWAANAIQDENRLTVVVMDPLAAPLSCPCVEGYAQRDYQALADYLETQLDRPVRLEFGESLTEALKIKTDGHADLVIGKDSVVRFDAAESRLVLQPVARLTGKDGSTTQTGLIVVRSDDPAKKLEDLKDYRMLFGPASADEKHSAVIRILEQAGIQLPKRLETSQACSDGACKIIEWGSDVRAAAVISSYAKPLLEGCGTIEKGDLRVIAETAPVPFVTAFVNKQIPVQLQQQLQKALLDSSNQDGLRAALETLLGFVPVADHPAVAEKKN